MSDVASRCDTAATHRHTVDTVVPDSMSSKTAVDTVVPDMTVDTVVPYSNP
eukprot:SAG25_NODE_673_length_6002_cov_4.287481_1_plen_51_part_00